MQHRCSGIGRFCRLEIPTDGQQKACEGVEKSGFDFVRLWNVEAPKYPFQINNRIPCYDNTLQRHQRLQLRLIQPINAVVWTSTTWVIP